MHNTKEKFSRINKYNKENYYRPNVILPKEYEEQIKRKAEKAGSMSKYIKQLIDRDLEEHPATNEQQINIGHGKE